MHLVNILAFLNRCMSCGLEDGAGSLRSNSLILSIYILKHGRIRLPGLLCLFSFDRSKHALAEDLRKSRLEGCDGVFEFRQYVLIDVFIGAFGVTLSIKKQGTIGSLLFYADVDQLIF